MMWWSVLRFLLSIAVFVVCLLVEDATAAVGDYTHEWAVRIDGGEEQALKVALEQNFDIVDKLFNDVFVFSHRRLARRSAVPSVHYHRALDKHPQVSWAQQQQVKRRVKRDYNSVYQRNFSPTSAVSGYDYHDHPHSTTVLNDPQWPQMWYLNRGSGLDMRVQEAWAEGVTGKGVVATILDDGLEKGHPDIIKNYDPDASYDVNNRDNDPMPRYDLIDTNRHGTRCAGEVAADANNSICAVGVAFEASIGGVRMLDGDVTDAVEARSLALNPQHIDIYSASWGPDDDGKTVDGPGELATRAFIEGINNGRNGRGSIFIWASGNGGRAQDNCNCDGYTNAIWTLSISSATEHGNVPWYSEACSSTLATTYSSGSTGERKIITTDLHHECTTSHTGTSASAPLAAGIVALALEVNRNLTWRDMQHIVVRTARPDNLATTDWQKNGVGRKVSHRFGYGLMDAFAMVQLARNWLTVAPQRSCEVTAPHDDKLIPQKSYVTLKLEVSSCPGVNHMEHVQAMVSLQADRRGDLEIYLISPAGTKSTLLAQRPHDNSRAGFHFWPFMTVHMWEEKPLGIWTLEIHNNGRFYTNGKVEMRGFTLVLHGTEVEPGKPAPSSGGATNFPSAISSNHVTHQDLVHSDGDTNKDSNTQRHNPPDGQYTGADGRLAGHHLPSGSDGNSHEEVGHSSAAATQPTPILLSIVMTEAPSVKKAGVEEVAANNVPQPVKLPSPSEGSDSGLHQGSISVTPPKVFVTHDDCLNFDRNAGACLECSSGQYLYRKGCIRFCPDGHYPSNTSVYSATGAVSHVAPTCGVCHYSCRQCSGQWDHQCLSCWPDSQLHTQPEGQHCLATNLVEAYSAAEGGLPLVVVVIASILSAIMSLATVALCCLRAYRSTGTSSSSTNQLISNGVDKLRDFKNGLHSDSKKTGSSGGAAYRKLSDDTEKLVTSNRPFYDYTSDEEDDDNEIL